MEFGSSGGEWDGEHNGASFVEVSYTFLRLDDFLIETVSFDRS